MSEYTIVVIGGGGVGKTSLTVQLTENSFDEEYNPTIEDNYQKEMIIDDKKYQLNILDTAGQEEYAVLRDQYWRSGDGFLIVFDITNKQSFGEIDSFFGLIQKAQEVENYPIVLCGNKCDLDNLREVSKDTASSYAKKNMWPYFETSAKKCVNVEESFISLVRFITKYKKAMDDDGSEEKKVNRKGRKKGGFFANLFKKKKK